MYGIHRAGSNPAVAKTIFGDKMINPYEHNQWRARQRAKIKRAAQVQANINLIRSNTGKALESPAPPNIWNKSERWSPDQSNDTRLGPYPDYVADKENQEPENPQ